MKKYKNVIIIAACAIFGVIILFLLYNQIDAGNKIRNQIEAEKSEKQLLENRLKILQEQSGNLPLLREQFQAIGVMLPQKSGYDTFISFIRGKTSENNLDLISISFSTEIPMDNYIEIPLTVTVEGNYVNLVSMLDSFNKSGRTVRMNDIKITSLQDKPSTIRADLQMSVFYTIAIN